MSMVKLKFLLNFQISTEKPEKRFSVLSDLHSQQSTSFKVLHDYYLPDKLSYGNIFSSFFFVFHMASWILNTVLEGSNKTTTFDKGFNLNDSCTINKLSLHSLSFIHNDTYTQKHANKHIFVGRKVCRQEFVSFGISSFTL